VGEAENIYADLNDSIAALQTIDSGFAKTYKGKDRTGWDRIYRQRLKDLTALVRTSTATLSSADARALDLMRTKVTSLSADSGKSESPVCKDAVRDLAYPGLRVALYACFDHVGGNLDFDGQKLSRLAVLDLLRTTEDPSRRKALFLALLPLWESINAKNEPKSPYRRLIRLARGDASSALTTATHTLGIDPKQAESWMEQALEAWRRANGDRTIEPWDFDFEAGKADRILNSSISRESLLFVTERYYRDLGADLQKMGVIYDLDPRAGKSPVAYTDFATYGRSTAGVWHPSIPRISATYTRGSLSWLNELIHEAGHAVHIAAVRTRPAFMDLGDSLFVEAFADVASWNTYQPAWQQKYLGRAASEADSLRSLFSSVILDVAWSLFEIRMQRDPGSDPNQVWTEITSHYLHIAPHPEWSWWAVRGQLVDSPGYMINYGLGAVLTADLRRHIRESLRSFDTGDPRWYPWVSNRLLRYGLERETPELLREFLGRPVSPQALLEDLSRLAPR
jgi:hypothetical protein